MYYNYGYDYGMANSFWHMSAGATLFSWLLAALVIVSMWFIFQKANEPGWAAIVPFYNTYELYKITWGNGWMFLLLLIPIAGLVIHIITMIKLAKAFGKGAGWGWGLFFFSFIFMPIMAFNKNIVYVGVPGKEGQNNGGQQGYQQGYQQQGYQNPYSQGYQAPQQPYQAPDTQQGTYQQQSSQNPEYFYQQSSAPSGPKYCAGCGTPIEGNVKYCPKCGKPQ